MMYKENVFMRIERCGVVPVATIDKAEKALPLANAMLSGGIDVIEITFRTDAAADAIRAIAQECGDMLVGAGTIITVEQCVRAVESGAQFIVCPGFSEKVVSWCVEHKIPVVPGCVTPTEITAAMEHGLKVLKFFPSDVYGGLNALKALHGPFPGVKFIPTGGVNEGNIGAFSACPYVLAGGGSWLCSKGDIEKGDFEHITQMCKAARRAILGFELVHIGINCADSESARETCMKMNSAFGFEYLPGNSSDFASKMIEVKKDGGRGTCGHLAIGTNSIPAAVAEMSRRGFELDDGSYTYKNGELIAVYLKDEMGGFAVHLMKKN